MSTRLLLTIAAIAVAGAIANVPNAFLFNALHLTAPWALGVAAGIYVLPGLLAMVALRRPGVGILAQLLAGLIAMPFAPTGPASVTAYLLLGALLEIPFLVTRYRRWNPWMFAIAAAFLTIVYAVLWGQFYDTAAMGPLALIGQPVLLFVAVFGMALIAHLLVRLLEPTGVLRGLRGPLVREPRPAS